MDGLSVVGQKIKEKGKSRGRSVNKTRTTHTNPHETLAIRRSKLSMVTQDEMNLAIGRYDCALEDSPVVTSKVSLTMTFEKLSHNTDSKCQNSKDLTECEFSRYQRKCEVNIHYQDPVINISLEKRRAKHSIPTGTQVNGHQISFSRFECMREIVPGPLYYWPCAFRHTTTT